MAGNPWDTMIRGKCNAPDCGQDARTGGAFYCAAHTADPKVRKKQNRKAAEPDAQVKEVVVGALADAPKSTNTKAPSQLEWDHLLEPIVIFITGAMVVGVLQHRDQPGITSEQKLALESERQRLSLSDEDAGILIKPFTRLIASTSLNDKWGRKIMDNADIFLALYVLWEWNQKLRPYARERKEYRSTGKIAEQIFYNGMAQPAPGPVYQQAPYQAPQQPIYEPQTQGDTTDGTTPPQAGPTLDDGEYGSDPHPPWYYKK